MAQPDSTQWSIVYELQEGVVHFQTSGNKETRTVDLSKLDLDCTADPLVLDLLVEGSGDVSTKLVPYSTEANRKLIGAGFSAKSVTAPTDEIIDMMVAYPEGLLCTFDTHSDR